METKSRHAPLPDRPLKPLRHTTPDRAALCDAIEPLLKALHDGAWGACNRRPDGLASPETLATARALVAETRRLCEREPDSARLGGLKFRAPLKLFDLALRVSVAFEAVQAFRGRYYGWHPALRTPAWHLVGERAVEEAERLRPRTDAAPPAPPKDAAYMAEMRAKVDRLLEAKAEELARKGPPYVLPPIGPDRQD
jgi:hypothetical protein